MLFLKNEVYLHDNRNKSMKRLLCHIILYMFCATAGQAQSIWTTVESEKDIIDGAVYMITTKTTDGKKISAIPHPEYNPYGYSCKSSDGNKTYYFSSITNSINQVLQLSHLFKFVKIDDIWYIKDINWNKYIGKNTISGIGNSTLFEARDIPDENCETSFTFSSVKNTAKITIKVGSRYLVHKDHNSLQLNSQATTTENEVDIYRLNYTVLDAGGNLKPQNSNNTTVLYRNFLTDIYNTMIIPCSITNYKTIFGNNVTAYEVKAITDSKIIISTVSGTALNANTPYLLKGSSFNSSPYVLGTQTINYDGNTDPVTTFSAGSIHGVYATRALPTKNAYFMYQDEFLPYNSEYYNNKSMTISPYKWYVETPSTSSAKAIVIDEQDATSIHTPGAKKQETGVYDLNGRLVGTSTKKPLQKGIYVVNGQKTVIQ